MILRLAYLRVNPRARATLERQPWETLRTKWVIESSYLVFFTDTNISQLQRRNGEKDAPGAAKVILRRRHKGARGTEQRRRHERHQRRTPKETPTLILPLMGLSPQVLNLIERYDPFKNQ
jgi:hypothetical protein